MVHFYPSRGHVVLFLKCQRSGRNAAPTPRFETWNCVVQFYISKRRTIAFLDPPFSFSPFFFPFGACISFPFSSDPVLSVVSLLGM